MADHRIRAILVGASLSRTGTSLTVALGLLVGSYFLLTYTRALGDALNNWISTGLNLVFVMLVFLVVSAVHSYLYNGILPSVVLVAAPLMGFFYSGNMAFYWDPALVEYVWIGLKGGFFYGTPVGVLGYLIGRGLARFQGAPPGSSAVASR